MADEVSIDGEGKRKSPVLYTPEVAEEICRRLAAGERWHAIAGKDGLPTHTAPYKWRKDRPEFREAFDLARRVGADGRADQVLDVAEAATPATVSVARAHIGALKWHVDRETKLYAEEKDLGGSCRIVVEVRRFERVVGEDGTAFVRETLPSGETVDL